VTALSRYGPRAAIAAAGLAIAAGIVLTDDRDPFVFAIPALALTAVVVVALTLSDRRDEDAQVARLTAETGLDDDGVRPLPTVTPILAGVREPAHAVAGDLAPGGPLVRMARTGDRLVAITEAPADALDAAARAWLDDQPLRADAGIEDGLLVVAAHRDAPPAALLALTRELYARL
jgi:hypothetical protein